MLSPSNFNSKLLVRLQKKWLLGKVEAWLEDHQQLTVQQLTSLILSNPERTGLLEDLS